MPEQIIGSPDQKMMHITPEGAVAVSGTFTFGEQPLDAGYNYATELIYITSGTATGISTGSEIGSIVKHYSTGSFVRVLTYSNNQLINVGSWV